MTTSEATNAAAAPAARAIRMRAAATRHGPDRAGAPGRRRARRLPGRRLPGAARGRHRARLGDRHLDRRHQRQPHRRQRRRGPLARLREFWRTGRAGPLDASSSHACRSSAHARPTGSTVSQRHPGASSRRTLAAFASAHVPLGAESAGYYRPRRWRATLTDLVDFERIADSKPRLTVGAANVRTRRDALLRQPRRAARRPARDGVGRAAARLPGRPHRRRALTGTAASSPTRRSRRCSTTIPAGTR